MADAYIIDAVRTPRGIGKIGKGALSHMHPEQLSASVLAALKERNNLDTGDVDDVIWGVSAGVGLQGGDIGRNAALDAGFDIKASGVTLNRFCGSGITATSFGAAMISALPSMREQWRPWASATATGAHLSHSYWPPE